MHEEPVTGNVSLEILAGEIGAVREEIITPLKSIRRRDVATPPPTPLCWSYPG